MSTIEITRPIASVRLGVSNNYDTPKALVTDVPLPSDAPARLKTLRADGKKWYVTVGYLPDSTDPFVLFCHTNHKEKTAPIEDAVERLTEFARKSGIPEEYIESLQNKIQQDSNVNKLTRTISLLLRHKVPIPQIVTLLDTVDNVFAGSFLFQIKKFLAQHIKEGEAVEGEKCAECGGTLVYSEGCMACSECGNSKCG